LSCADYAATEIERFYRKDLAGQMGNLLSRIANKKLIKKLESPEFLYTLPTELQEEDTELLKLMEDLPGASLFLVALDGLLTFFSLSATFANHLTSFEIHRALAAVFDVLTLTNKRLSSLSPWLASASPSDVHSALFFGSESLRLAGILLQPFMPEKSMQMLDTLGVPADRRKWEDAVVGEGGKREMQATKKHLWPSVVVPGTVVEAEKTA
jgi:methionyl-tRNA synthetase